MQPVKFNINIYSSFFKNMNRIEKLLEYLSASPEDPFLQHALGMEYVNIGKELEAKKLFENILIKNPEYVGSYYQLGKLLEREGNNNEAVEWYEKGMQAAKQAGDAHSYNELQAAYEDLVY